MAGEPDRWNPGFICDPFDDKEDPWHPSNFDDDDDDDGEEEPWAPWQEVDDEDEDES